LSRDEECRRPEDDDGRRGGDSVFGPLTVLRADRVAALVEIA